MIRPRVNWDRPKYVSAKIRQSVAEAKLFMCSKAVGGWFDREVPKWLNNGQRLPVLGWEHIIAKFKAIGKHQMNQINGYDRLSRISILQSCLKSVASNATFPLDGK